MSRKADAIATMTRAFSEDPPSRWLYPDLGQFEAIFPAFVEAFAGAAFECGTAYAVEDSSTDLGGVALWLPPGLGPDEAAIGELVERTVAPERLEAAFELFEQFGQLHPHDAHWYLPMVGVEPASQGRGYGAALLRHALQTCDRDSLPAYLEATSPRSAALYQRHGFEIVGIIQVADSPQIFPMLRQPR
jgi:ribosomal protein S18 acetylase RimI-like enzyme